MFIGNRTWGESWLVECIIVELFTLAANSLPNAVAQSFVSLKSSWEKVIKRQKRCADEFPSNFDTIFSSIKINSNLFSVNLCFRNSQSFFASKTKTADLTGVLCFTWLWSLVIIAVWKMPKWNSWKMKMGKRAHTQWLVFTRFGY